MKKLIATAAISLFIVSTQTAAAADAVVDKYNKTCKVCHETGAAGAPLTGSAEQWKDRLAKGPDTLLNSVKNGFNAMPPKAMCYDCTDDDYKALIEYMSTAK